MGGFFSELTIKGGHLSPNTYPTAISMLDDGLLPMKVSLFHPRNYNCHNGWFAPGHHNSSDETFRCGARYRDCHKEHTVH